MFVDPMYIVLVLLPGLLISGGASLLVRSAFGKYSKVRSHNGYTGAQAAQRLLDKAGIHDESVVPVRGMLTDHYNLRSKQLALSEQVYSSQSVAAIDVACHEAGHAIQHANNYGPLGLRLEVVHHLRKRALEIPCILISGDLDETIVQEALEADVFSVEPKPLSLSHLRTLVRQATRQTYDWPAQN